MSESIEIASRAYSSRYVPTGDTVPKCALGPTIRPTDGTTANAPVEPYVRVAFPIVRNGGTADNFQALTVWYFRCAPGETFDPADFGDEVFPLDDQTQEYVFTYPCPPLSGEGSSPR